MLKMFVILLAFILSTIFVFFIIQFCNKHKIYDKVTARKIHTGNIPRLGGIGFIIAFFISAIVYLKCQNTFNAWKLLPLLIAMGLIFLQGLIDDIFDLRARIKLLFQIIAAVILIFNGYRFKQIAFLSLPVWFQYILSFFWIIGITNSFNLIDGLDALCGGLSAIACITIGIILFYSSPMNSILMFILAATICGFLLFNRPQAKVFMGDCGSQFLGFVFAVAPLYESSPDIEYNKFFIMCLLAAIPMMDTIAAIWRRIREKRSIMSSDNSHIHHKLINIGYTKTQALIILLILQLIIALSTLLSLYLYRSKGSILLIVVFVFVVFFFIVIHYANSFINNSSQGTLVKKIEEEK